MKRFLALGILAFTSVGCGTGNDPLTIIGSGNTIPQLEFPFATTATVAGSGFSPFTSTADFHRITVTNTGANQNVISPVAGVVVALDAHSLGSIATIYHNSALSIRVAAPAISARKGDYLQAGSVIGTTTSVADIYVTQNGVSACGYSFFSATARARAIPGLAGAIPCQ